MVEIVKDENMLLEFVNNVLPDLYEGEVYYGQLMFRRKYTNTQLPKSEGVLKRFIANSKKNLIEKIYGMELKRLYKFNDVEIPNDACVLYILPNPRSVKGVMKNMQKTITDRCFEGDFNFSFNDLYSLYQQTKSSKHSIMDYDFDTNDETKIKGIIDTVNTIVNKDCYTVIKTRGGIHILVDSTKVEKEFSKTWFQNMLKIDGLDKNSNRDTLLPVPGCVHGKSVPFILSV